MDICLLQLEHGFGLQPEYIDKDHILQTTFCGQIPLIIVSKGCYSIIEAAITAMKTIYLKMLMMAVVYTLLFVLMICYKMTYNI